MSYDEDGWHTCHFCGTYVKDGYEDVAKSSDKRHFLSDCRPDLVEHEIGSTCTWAYRRMYFIEPDINGRRYIEKECCYAYESNGEPPNYARVWTNEHKHFYKDGPM